MKRLLIFLSLLAGCAGHAQETLSPVSSNSHVYYSSTEYQRSHGSARGHKADAILQKGTLLIESDTLSLPFIDDFTTNTLKPSYYDQYIYDTIFRAYGPCDTFLMTDTVMALFCTVQSYTYTFDTALKQLDSVPTQPIVFHYYPMSGSDCFDHLMDSMTLYPLWYHYIFDSTSGIGYHQTLDSVAYDTLLAYSPILYRSKMPAYTKWIDNYAYVNNTYPYLPPSIGVATLDGLNEYGRPYNNSTPTTHGYADTLTSKPINLGPYTDADSVYLSFFYEPRGYGDYPNTGDSLFLEFYNGYTSTWDNVWGVDGFAQAPNWPDTFHQVIMRIPSTIVPNQEYLFNGFQFRFRNIASLAGNNDHWHIDYVRLNKNRSVTDTAISDIAFQYPFPSVLKNYEEMPAWQYMDSTDLSDSLGLYVTNLDQPQAQQNPPATQFTIMANEVYPNPGLTYTTTSSFNAATENVLNLYPSSEYKLSAGPFDSLVINSEATINVTNYLATNDTIRRTQTLNNVLAYDDGSAEMAYGLRNLDLKKFGYEFLLHQPDTIIGYQVLFTNIDVDVHDLVFVYNVWDSIKLNDPFFVDSAVYSSTNQVPDYIDSVNGFATYRIDPIPVPTKFYFGWSQNDARYLQIGYDRNSTKGFQHMYVYTSGTWKPTSIQTPGSPMIRLLMRHSSQIASGIKDVTAATIKAYPNPTTGIVRFELPDAQSSYEVELFNTMGQRCFMQTLDQSGSIDIHSLPAGIYMLRLSDTRGGLTYQNKIIRSAY